MCRILLLLLLSVPSMFGQSVGMQSAGAADTTSAEQIVTKKRSLAGTVVKEAIIGIGGGVVSAFFAVGVYSAFGGKHGDVGETILVAFGSYGCYTTGIGVATNLSAKADGYNPPMWGTVTVSFLSGVASTVLFLRNVEHANSVWYAYPLYVPLISSIVFNHLAGSKQAPTNDSKPIDVFPGISRHGGTINLHMAL